MAPNPMPGTNAPFGAPAPAMQQPMPAQAYPAPGPAAARAPSEAREKRAVIIAAVFAGVGVLALVAVLLFGR
jgi:hypothetical protein